MITTTTTVRGMEAISYLTGYSLGAEATITEHRCGIDIDNAARPYDHESQVTYDDVMWTVLLYVPSKFEGTGCTFDDLFSAEVETGIRNGNTEGKIHSLSIHTDIFDCESHGTHFEFRYAS